MLYHVLTSLTLSCPATTCRPTTSINERVARACRRRRRRRLYQRHTDWRSPRAEHGTERPRGEHGVWTIIPPPAPPLRSSVGGFFPRRLARQSLQRSCDNGIVARNNFIAKHT